jgi:V8-like Glu-specific endopeptidase
MKLRTLQHLFAAFLTLVVLPTQLEAQVPQAIIDRTVLVRNNRSCGSGVLLDSNTILTNAHLARSLCRGERCQDITVARAKALGTRASQVLLKQQSISVEYLSHTFDAALLRSNTSLTGATNPLRFAPASEELAIKGLAIQLLGFPRCRVLRATRGTITSETNLRFTTDAQGSHGSSGSPIFNLRFELIGLVDEAATIREALTDAAFNSGFSLRAVKATHIEELQNLDGDNRISYILQQLQRFLSSSLDGLPPRARALRALRLDSGLRDLQRDGVQYSEDPQVLSALLAANDYPTRFIWSAPQTSLALSAEAVALQYSLERYGLSAAFLQPLHAEMLTKHLSATKGKLPQSPDIISRVERLSDSGYRGYQSELLLAGMPIALAILMLVAAWCWSLGTVFAWSRGGFLRRVFLSTLVGVLLWPISLFVFWYIAGRRNA